MYCHFGSSIDPVARNSSRSFVNGHVTGCTIVPRRDSLRRNCTLTVMSSSSPAASYVPHPLIETSPPSMKKFSVRNTPLDTVKSADACDWFTM